MTRALLGGVVAGYGIAVPVGAIGAYLVALTAHTSGRVGAAAGLGVATADGIYALLAVLAGAALAPLILAVADPLRWVSVVVLLALAAHIGLSGVRAHRRRDGGASGHVQTTTAVRAYLRLLALTLVNPLTLVYFASLVAGGLATGAARSAEQLSFVVGALAASASWQLLLVGGGVVVGRALTGTRGRLVTALCSSAVVTALALRLALAP